jgi:hypothetical protein
MNTKNVNIALQGSVSKHNRHGTFKNKILWGGPMLFLERLRLCVDASKNCKLIIIQFIPLLISIILAQITRPDYTSQPRS